MYKLNGKSAFFNEEIYMKQPQGFVENLSFPVNILSKNQSDC